VTAVAGLERALPASWYLGAEQFRRERERLLYREWFCAGRADQVERPGSLVVVDVAGESVLLARARAGARVLGLEQFPLGHHRGASHDHARIIRRSYHTPGYVR
jgi:hypothetical protein